MHSTGLLVLAQTLRTLLEVQLDGVIYPTWLDALCGRMELGDR